MRFSLKIFICTLLVVAISFAAGGYLLVSSSFLAAKDREINRSLDEYTSLQYMLESELINEELNGKEITKEVLKMAVEKVSGSIKQSKQSDRDITVYDSSGQQVYPEEGSKIPEKDSTDKDKNLVYHIEKKDNIYNLYITGMFTYNSISVYFRYSRDISEVFVQKNEQIRLFMVYDSIIIMVSAMVVFGLSWLLTRPVRKLTLISSRIASGEYKQRVDIKSSDEIGELAQSFNRMADSIEDKINELEVAANVKDEFIANFTHELKTPMTSIIGYADMLRSRLMDPDTTFKAANYIYNEANRLEALSLKMLDLVVMEQNKFSFTPINADELLEYVKRVVTPSFSEENVNLKLSIQKGVVFVEPDLIKTLLVNIVDNARKASYEDGVVELLGISAEEGYIITVTDKGEGIPKSELGKITEAFYMVDKSRARAKNGTGLGLAIASRIAALHDSELQINSEVGIGTKVSITLPYSYSKGGDRDEQKGKV
ncbi:two-component sensor histidine kinase [Clostridium zeae]|uniref:histidine kinase n=1 Tax=Clostridium zeae TaxID=2759022 RepID=A0ABQ1EE17_9CLOT|nr:HAMP domain-containing sensor histidine kinase [Clostridium zeae]GFZ33027.1 two-component sensor histidine kinase [Clostridium zeae]